MTEQCAASRLFSLRGEESVRAPVSSLTRAFHLHIPLRASAWTGRAQGPVFNTVSCLCLLSHGTASLGPLGAGRNLGGALTETEAQRLMCLSQVS